MKLSELLVGKKFPVKVTRLEWPGGDWFEILADTRTDGNYPGFYQNGSAYYLDEDDIIFTDWELYIEPRKKKKSYAWMVTMPDATWIEFQESPSVFRYSLKTPIKIQRMPEFDTEVEE